MAPARFAPRAERLPDRVVPDASASTWPVQIGQAVSTDDGGLPIVHLLSSGSNHETEFAAYDLSFRGGVRTALGDVTGDGVWDVVTAAGPGGGPHVKVFDGNTGAEVRSFYAYHAGFDGGVEVAVGDVNRDGYGDIITGAGPGGGPHVKVFDGKTGTVIASFYAFAQNFVGGVFVASGDVNRDGYDDVVTGAGQGGSPHVRGFDGRTGVELTSFYAFGRQFGGGVRVASGDLNGDGVDDLIVAAGPGGGPHVRGFDARTGELLVNRFVADASHHDGVRLAVADHFIGRPDGIISRTRTGDQVDTLTFTTADANDWPQSVWVGDGNMPPGGGSISVLPRSTQDITPIRTVAGPITAITSDGKSMTIQRGDGASVVIDLDGDDALPPGSVLIDGVLLPPADIILGDEMFGVGQLHVGRWVRVEVARASNPAAKAFQAISVRLL